MPEHDLRLADGRTLHVHDSGGAGEVVVWHHGSPQTGAPLAPVLAACERRGLRHVSYGRPSYGGSSPHPDRDVASAARDVEQLADALGIGRFAVAGASGGGPHALACAALLPERVTGVVCLATPAPYTDDFDWFGGMVAPGALRAAREGRDARARFDDTFDENCFTAADWAALEHRWASLGEDATRAGTAGSDGLIDDDVAFAKPWGCEVSAIAAPVLLAHGLEDRVIPHSHSEHLLRAPADAELWLRRNDGHVSILDATPLALDWLSARARA